jgi:hypothetical protein
MKKITLVLFFVAFTVQSTFAWGWATRDASRQSSENPTYYLGDQVTLYWFINSTGWGATYKKAGIGTTNSSGGMNWQNISWDNDAGDGNGNNEGIKSQTFTVNSVATWYYSLWLGWGSAIGDNGAYNNGGSTWTEGNTSFQSSSFTVSALDNTTLQTATQASSSTINLSWTKWNSKNVMILRKKATDAWTEPSQGSAYTVGTTLGSCKVIYNSGGTNFTDASLEPNTIYDYKFYSENYSYYSAGATTQATTANSTNTDYFRSKTTGNWNTAETWESSPNNTNWVTSTLVPNASATSITVLSGHNVTLDTDVTISGLIVNSGGTFTATDASARTLTIIKSTSGSATTIANSGIWANGSGVSTVVFTGAPGSGDAIHAISGTIGFQNITVNKTGGASNVGASFGANSSLTGTLEIGVGGFISTAPPTSFYGSNAILKFNQGSGATYDVNSTDNSWSTTVIPNYITISSGIVNLNADRTATGDLLIDGGALVLNSNNPNLTIQGNWVRTSGTFTANSGTVTLSGGNNTPINVAGSANMNSLIISKTSGAIVTLESSLITNSLTISSGAQLSVIPGKQVTVNTSLTNNGTLTLQSSVSGTATIITPTSIGGTGAVSIQHYLADARNWYMSSPISGASSLPTVDTGSLTFFSYPEADASQVTGGNGMAAGSYWNTVSSGTFALGTGYIIRPSASASTVTFSGTTLNSNDIPIGLTYSAANPKHGFNLIGNPYPCHLSWTYAFTNANSSLIESSIWVRTTTGTNNTNGTWSFATFNATSAEAVPTTANAGIIAPMQGFWIRAKQAGTLTLNTNLTKSHQSSNPLKAHAATNADRQRVRLVVSNGTSTDEALVYFDAAAANDYDDYDSPKMPNSIATIPEIYTQVNGQKLVINGMNSISDNLEIPLGFSTGQSNTFTIKATQLSNIPSDTKVYLKDNTQLNPPTELILDQDYTFTSDVSIDNTSRFSLLFKAPSITTGTDLVKNQLVRVFGNENNQIVIERNVQSENAVAYIYNAVGQLMQQLQLSNTINTSGVTYPCGTYFVTIRGNNKQATTKLLINKI